MIHLPVALLDKDHEPGVQHPRVIVMMDDDFLPVSLKIEKGRKGCARSMERSSSAIMAGE